VVSPITATVYHCTHKNNLPSIMAEGLRRQDQYLFFFPTLESARENGLSDMAILEITLTGEDIDRCGIGEVFPDLYKERFCGEPPADTDLRYYLEHPVNYGVAEITCTVNIIPPDRIRYLETISRI